MPALPPRGARPDNDPPDLGLLSRALPSCPGRKRANTPRPSSPGVRTRTRLAARRASFAPPSTTRKVHRPKAGFPPGAPAVRRETRQRDRARPLPEHRSDRARATADVTRDRRYSSSGLFGRRQAMPSDSCSDLVVLHHLAGLLRARAAGVSACCRPWGSLRLRPWKPRPPRSALTPRRTSPRTSTPAVTRGDCPRAVPVASSSRSSCTRCHVHVSLETAGPLRLRGLAPMRGRRPPADRCRPTDGPSSLGFKLLSST